MGREGEVEGMRTQTSTMHRSRKGETRQTHAGAYGGARIPLALRLQVLNDLLHDMWHLPPQARGPPIGRARAASRKPVPSSSPRFTSGAASGSASAAAHL